MGHVIAVHEKRLVSGFGLVVGSASIAGALGVLLKESAPNLEKSLLLRPFPQEAPADTDMATFHARYRDCMIQQAGIVFICGLKEAAGGGAPVVADGVIEEFESAQRHGRIVIPIGATGGAAAEIWSRLDRAGLMPSGLTRGDFNRLNDARQTPAAGKNRGEGDHGAREIPSCPQKACGGSVNSLQLVS